MMWLGMNGVCRACESAFKLKLCDHDVLGYESALCRGCESAFKVKLTEQDVVGFEWGVQRL